jgi:trigger factor
MVTIELPTPVAARKLVTSTKLFRLAGSLGSVDSLVNHPATMTHASLQGTPHELPETLVQEEIMSLLEQTAGQLAQQGMDVKKLFTPQLVQSLRETSRPEAEERLKRSLALKALAASEKLELSDQEIDDKVKELSRSFSDTANIDPQRLRAAEQEDLMREKLLGWLEANSTITEKAADADADAKADA